MYIYTYMYIYIYIYMYIYTYQFLWLYHKMASNDSFKKIFFKRNPLYFGLFKNLLRLSIYRLSIYYV